MPAPDDDYARNQDLLNEGQRAILAQIPKRNPTPLIPPPCSDELKSQIEILKDRITKIQIGLEEEITANKGLRKSIDADIQSLKLLPSSRERALAITKLQEGVMWLGMDLKRINEISEVKAPNPYPNSYDPSNTKIEPTADGLKL